VRLVGVIFVAMIVAGCGTGGGGAYAPPLPSFPFLPGTTWLADYISVPTVGPARSGTLTVLYGGTATYRGTTYRYLDETSTLSPGVADRLYFVWTGVARTAAEVATCPTCVGITMLEIVYDKTWSTSVAESLLGIAQVYVNGAQSGTATAWSVSSANAGTFTITVPAGTFTTTRWNWLWNLGSLGTNASTYVAGSAAVPVREVGTSSSSGSAIGTYTLALRTGPVPTAIAAQVSSLQTVSVPIGFLMNAGELRRP
jgi:hypothetical protein